MGLVDGNIVDTDDSFGDASSLCTIDWTLWTASVVLSLHGAGLRTHRRCVDIDVAASCDFNNVRVEMTSRVVYAVSLSERCGAMASS